MSTIRQGNPWPPCLSSPGFPAQHRQSSHPVPVHVESAGHGYELLPCPRNPAGFDGLPGRSRHAGQLGCLLGGTAHFLADALDEHAEELAPGLASEGGAAGTGERCWKQITHILITPEKAPCQAGLPRNGLTPMSMELERLPAKDPQIHRRDVLRRRSTSPQPHALSPHSLPHQV